jgi:hypothetical protein
VPDAVKWLRKLSAAGAQIILWTMRSDMELGEAITWFKDRGIPLFAVNENPTQRSWTDSPKAYAHQYVDDAAAGCPLRENPRMGGRPFVDWSVVGPLLWKELKRREGPSSEIKRRVANAVTSRT